ncbi:lamin tail domain-containing protein [Cyclobacterium xiamenense]|uniref:lamin tail domain-containing protein n=1 Tax=Cyclobacterium xiamenense TaxID=1297121 RepID=UPI0035CFA218
MKAIILIGYFITFSLPGFAFFIPLTPPVTQDFEERFVLVNHPGEFLPGWSANELRTGSSRVFQASGQGVNQSSALGIQPIASFSAQIYIKIATVGVNDPRISFQARTAKNGSGTRPALVYLSFSSDPAQGFSARVPLGDTSTFPNQDLPFAAYSLPVPDEFVNSAAVTVLLEVEYGPGSGTAARLFLDDFSVESGPGQVPELSLTEASLAAENILSLQFNQPLQLQKEGVMLNNRYGTPLTIQQTANSEVQLEFDRPLYTNQYRIEFEQIEVTDTGQLLDDQAFTFSIHTPTPAGALIINEVMVDPNPKGRVPPEPVLPTAANAEYIELYNRLDRPLLLRGFTYNEAPIEERVIEPLSYLILCSPGTKPSLEHFGPLALVDPFRTLPNASGTIHIRDGFSNLIDSLTYSEEFYRNPEKTDGGWALERINPFQTCSDSFNWLASSAPKGGTPGAQNSVYSEEPDNRPFAMVAVQPLSAEQIRVTFSKALPAESGEAPSFSLSGLPLQVLQYRRYSLDLGLPEAMISGTSYLLKSGPLIDCFGQPLQSDTLSFVFDAIPPRLLSVWGISENGLLLVFDEALESTSASEPQNYGLQNGAGPVSTANIHERAPNQVRLQVEGSFQAGAKYTVQVSAVADLFGNELMEAEASFTWDNFLDSLFFNSPTSLGLRFVGAVAEESVLNPNNYFLLPAAIRPTRVLPAPEDAAGFILIFDRELPQNQDFLLEITGISDEEGRERFTFHAPLQWDTRPLQLNHLEIPTSHSLLLEFNKPLDPKWAAIPQFYEVNEGIGFPETLSLPGPEKVQLAFANDFIPGKTYRIQLSHLRDQFGEEMASSIYRSFTWDTLPPQLDTAFLLSPFELKMKWSKAIQLPDSVLVNHRLEKNIFLNETRKYLTLRTQRPLTDDVLHIRVPLVETGSGEHGRNVEYELDQSLFIIGNSSFRDQETLEISFTDFPDPGSVLFPENYRIGGRPPKEVQLSGNGYQVSLLLQETLGLGDTVSIAVAPIHTANGKSSRPHDSSLVYHDGILDIWMEQAQLLRIRQEESLDSTQPWMGDFLVLEEELQPEAFLNQSRPNQIQVILDVPIPVGASWTLQIPPRLTESGTRLPGSLRSFSWNPLPPELLEVEPLPANQLLLHFDKELNPVLAVVPGFYSANGEPPSWVSVEGNGDRILLTFDAGWENGQDIRLRIEALEDLDGNTIVPVDLVFPYRSPQIPGFRELVINELMPAPRGGNALPEAEYLELFNPTDLTFPLGGMVLSNSRTETTLPRASLGPGQYLILCPESMVEAFSRFGPVLGLKSWPTLLNSGDLVSLKNTQGLLVDRIRFDPGMPLGSEVSANGFSLEAINPWYPCESGTNYAPSISENKGTPGQPNSVFDASPDRTKPQLLSAIPEDDYRILLRFSKPVGPHNEESSFRLTPEREIRASYSDSLDQFQYVVELLEPLQQNQAYLLTTENWRDCSGNSIDPEAADLWLKIPGVAEEGDLLLNEILFNPDAGVPKFVEIYNHSEKYLNLKNWKLANATEGEITNRRIIAGGNLIVDPFDYLVVTTDVQRLAERYPLHDREKMVEMSLPSYPIRSGTVILLDPDENWVERLDYEEDFHHAFLRDFKGISLERYSVTAPTNDPENWHSASAHVGHASPGAKNSQVFVPGSSAFGISVTPEVFVPMATGEQPFTTISYTMETPGFQATLRIFTPTGVPVKVLCENAIWGAEGFYTWDGTNERGEKVNAGYYILSVELVHPSGQVQHLKKTVVVGAKF